MMISKTQIDQVLKVYRASKASKLTSQDNNAAKDVGQDDMKLSYNPDDIERIKQIAHAQPDIRLDKVEPLICALKSGEYHVDSKCVAEKMLGRLLADKLQ